MRTSPRRAVTAEQESDGRWGEISIRFRRLPEAYGGFVDINFMGRAYEYEISAADLEGNTWELETMANYAMPVAVIASLMTMITERKSLAWLQAELDEYAG